MKKLSIAILFLTSVMAWGAFLVPSASASTLSSLNSLDSVINNESTFFSLGKVGGFTEQGMSYYPGASHNICTVQLALEEVGSPADTLQLELRGVATTTTGASLYELSNQGTRVQFSDSVFLVNGSFQPITFTFTPCAVVVGANWYNFILTRSGSPSDTKYFNHLAGSSAVVTGTANWVVINRNAGNTSKNSLTGSDSYNIVLNGTQNFSAFQASSTTAFSPTNCTPPNSVLDVGGGVSYAFCFMFVPDPTLTNNFLSLPALLESKAPFGYFFQVADIFNSYEFGTSTQMLSVSTTYSPLLQGVASSSATAAMASLLPSHVDWLSTTTISVYFPTPIRNTFRGIFIIVIYVLLGWSIYTRINNLKNI